MRTKATRAQATREASKSTITGELTGTPLNATVAGVGDVGPHPLVRRVDAIVEGAPSVGGPHAPQVLVAQAGEGVVAVVHGPPRGVAPAVRQVGAVGVVAVAVVGVQVPVNDAGAPHTPRPRITKVGQLATGAALLARVEGLGHASTRRAAAGAAAAGQTTALLRRGHQLQATANLVAVHGVAVPHPAVSGARPGGREAAAAVVHRRLLAGVVAGVEVRPPGGPAPRL